MAWWAAERVHTLLDLPLPSMLGGPARTLPLRLVDAWLSHPAVRPFIRVNAWDGAEWFHRESWDELLAWVERLEWILRPRRPDSLGRSSARRWRRRSPTRPTCPATAWTGCARPSGPRRSLGLTLSPLLYPPSSTPGALPPRPGPEPASPPKGKKAPRVDREAAKPKNVQGGKGKKPEEAQVVPPRQDGTPTHHRVGLAVLSRRWAGFGRIAADPLDGNPD